MTTLDESQDAYECACMLSENRFEKLNTWEQDFIESVKIQYATNKHLSEKQVAIINRTFDKYMSSLA